MLLKTQKEPEQFNSLFGHLLTCHTVQVLIKVYLHVLAVIYKNQTIFEGIYSPLTYNNHEKESDIQLII